MIAFVFKCIHRKVNTNERLGWSKSISNKGKRNMEENPREAWIHYPSKKSTPFFGLTTFLEKMPRAT